MTDGQSNSLDMFLAVNQFYLENQALIDGVPARQLGFGKLKTNTTAINTNIGGQSASIKGVTQDKAALRNGLNEMTLGVLSPARAWALSISNNTLAEQFHVTESLLQNMKDDTVVGFCQMRFGLVNDNLSAMVDYGIEASIMSTWSDSITDYEEVLAGPRTATVTRKQKTTNLKLLFKETSTLVKETIDSLMLPLKVSDPEVYGIYQSARIIIDRKGHKGGAKPPKPPVIGVKIEGFTKNATTEEALAGVSVSESTSPNSASRMVISDSDGKFRFSYPDIIESEIEVTLVAQHADFAEATSIITAKKGEITVTEILMTPLAPPPPDPTP